MQGVLQRPTIAQKVSAKEALQQLEIEPFSLIAVAEYKRTTRAQALKNAPILDRVFVNHPRMLQRMEQTCIYLAIASFLLMIMTLLALLGMDGVNTFSQHPPFTLKDFGLVGLSVFGLIGIGVMVGACGDLCHWSQHRIPSLNWFIETPRRVDDIPQHAKNLMRRIRQLTTGVEFRVHQLGQDPLLEIRYLHFGSIQSDFIYGWDGDFELVEINGKIERVPRLK